MKPFVLLLAAGLAGTLLAAATDEPPAAYAKCKNPLKRTQALIASARLLYDLNCEFCHGLKGKGDGAKMSVRKGRPVPDFTGEAFGRRSDPWVLWRISEGVEKSMMQPYKDTFSEKERWSLVLLLRDFAPKPSPPKKAQK